MPSMTIRVEPQIPASTEITKVDEVRAVIVEHDAGQFRRPSLLLERMLWNPRLRGVVETRFNGLLATAIRWEAASTTPAARRVAEALTIDFPMMAPSPARRQLAARGVFLGVAFAQPRWVDGSREGRLLPVAAPYWPGFWSWHPVERRYRVDVDGSERQPVNSPTLSGRRDERWIVSEPFGAYSWREGLLHAAWRPWLGHDWATRDQNRASEKHGIGTIIFEYPSGSGDKWQESIDNATTSIRRLGSEGVLPAEMRPDGEPSFGYKPFEFSGTGFAAISEAMNAAAVSLAILLLGHNLTTEIKGGSFAAAGVADYIRDDVKNADALAEAAWLMPQLIEPWVVQNFGSAEDLPVPRYVTDSPSVNRDAALTLQALGSAVRELRAQVPSFDAEALLERFRVPLRDVGVEQIQVPAEMEIAEGTPEAGAADMGEPVLDEEQTAAEVSINITPTDEAATVTVDEVRRLRKLPEVGGDIGQRWVVEHAALIRAEAEAAAREINPPAPSPFGAPTQEAAPPDEDEDADEPPAEPVDDESTEDDAPGTA